MSSTDLLYSTALVIILPNAYHDVINQLRAKHDHAYPRWMPHITLYYPFTPVDKFDEIAEKLRPALSGFGPFEVNLNQVSHFRQKRNTTIHLRAEDDSQLQDLFRTIHNILPEFSIRRQFIPHVTIGQASFADNETMKASFQQYFQERDMRMIISEIHLIHRSELDPSVPFSIYSSLSL